jgi:deoxyadenosine/deoxycytidine kinase
MSYEEPLRWAFTFEANVFVSMAKLHRKTSTCSVKAMERSIHGCRNCFTENLKNMKWLNDAEYKILDDLFQITIDKGSCHVDLFGE